MLQAADEGGSRPFRPACQLDGFQPGQELGVERAGLHPGEGGTEAEVDAEAEREMPVGVAADVEAERVLEDLLSLKARPSIRTGTWWPPGHALRGGGR